MYPALKKTDRDQSSQVFLIADHRLQLTEREAGRDGSKHKISQAASEWAFELADDADLAGTLDDRSRPGDPPRL